MQEIRIGDVTITSLVERDGPWRAPGAFFLGYDPAVHRPALEALGPVHYDAPGDRLMITYQTFLVRTPRHTILVDTCTGEDKGFPPPLDFPKQPWLDAFKRTGLRFEDIDYVFCTHLHFDHCGWNTVLRDGRWVPTFPKAKYVFHKREYEAAAAAAARGDGPPGNVWAMNCEPVVAAGQALLVDDDFALDDLVTLLPTPGHSVCHCCIDIRSGGQRAVVTGDLVHHALQCEAPDLSTIFCSDPAQAARSRRGFLHSVADTDTLILPVHIPAPTVGRIEGKGDRFRYVFAR